LLHIGGGAAAIRAMKGSAAATMVAIIIPLVDADAVASSAAPFTLWWWSWRLSSWC
jgi:hypothetical protein